MKNCDKTTNPKYIKVIILMVVVEESAFLVLLFPTKYLTIENISVIVIKSIIDSKELSI